MPCFRGNHLSPKATVCRDRIPDSTGVVIGLGSRLIGSSLFRVRALELVQKICIAKLLSCVPIMNAAKELTVTKASFKLIFGNISTYTSVSMHFLNSIHVWLESAEQGPVSLRLMTSQFKDIVTHTQKLRTVKCMFCGVWVQNFLWNFKGALWNFTQNVEPIRHKICILRGVKILTTYDILELWHLKS